jgi:phenylalanyl-tRNA synthetase beta chain
VSLVLKNEIEVGGMLEFIKKIAPPILQKTTLTDFYIGEQIKMGKGVTIKLEFLSNVRTLEQKEVDIIVATLLERLKQEYDITLRS